MTPSRTTPRSNDSSNSPTSEGNSASSSSTLKSKYKSPSGEPVSSSHCDPQLVPGVSATPSRTIGGNEQQKTLSPVDKYLKLPTAPKKKEPAASSSTRAMTGARVLTIAECLAIIKEKETEKEMARRGKGEQKETERREKRSNGRRSKRRRNKKY